MAREGDTKNQNFELTRANILRLHILYIREKASSQKMTLQTRQKKFWRETPFCVVCPNNERTICINAPSYSSSYHILFCVPPIAGVAVIDLFHPSPLNNAL